MEKTKVSWSVLMKATPFSMVSFKFHWNLLSPKMAEVQIPKNSTLCTFPKIGRRAFLLARDEQKLACKSIYYREEPNFLRNCSPQHLVKVKLNVGEREFQLYMTFALNCKFFTIPNLGRLKRAVNSSQAIPTLGYLNGPRTCYIAHRYRKSSWITSAILGFFYRTSLSLATCQMGLM